jgi:hypothetical protein
MLFRTKTGELKQINRLDFYDDKLYFNELIMFHLKNTSNVINEYKITNKSLPFVLKSML